MSVLLRKELTELVRTQKILVLPLAFAFFGVAGPVLIRVLPLIAESAQAGVAMDLPEMGPADGLIQFMEMSRQFGILAVILMYMGAIAGERRRGTLAFLLVKPVLPSRFLASRWGVNAAYVSLSFLLGSAVAAAATTAILGSADVQAFLAATGLYLSYLLLAYSWTFLFSGLTSNPPVAGGISLIPLFTLPAVGALWEPLETYGPYGAVHAGTSAIGGIAGPATAIPSTAVVSATLNVGLSLLLVAGAWWALRHKEL